MNAIAIAIIGTERIMRCGEGIECEVCGGVVSEEQEIPLCRLVCVEAILIERKNWLAVRVERGEGCGGKDIITVPFIQMNLCNNIRCKFMR